MYLTLKDFIAKCIIQLIKSRKNYQLFSVFSITNITLYVYLHCYLPWLKLMGTFKILFGFYMYIKLQIFTDLALRILFTVCSKCVFNYFLGRVH